ncbi:MAG: hypothetical protein ACOX12_01095 [Eggerthellaceae bacterium]
MAEILDDVAYLSQEIGPRPAGTEEEQQAALFIADQVHSRTNLKAEIEDIKCNADSTLVDIIYFGVAFLAVALSLVIPAIGVITLLVSILCTVCFLCEERFQRPILSKLLSRDISQNVVVKYRPEAAARSGSRRKVIVVANYDSGKVMNDVRPGLLNLWSKLGYGADVAMVAAPIILFFKDVVFLNALGFVSGFFFLLAVIDAVLLLVPLVRALIHRAGAYNEAANVNASGVAVMLDLIRRVGNSEDMPQQDEQQESAEERPVIQGEEAARAAGVVPEGAELTYEPGSQEEAPVPENQPQPAQPAAAVAEAPAPAPVAVAEEDQPVRQTIPPQSQVPVAQPAAAAQAAPAQQPTPQQVAQPVAQQPVQQPAAQPEQKPVQKPLQNESNTQATPVTGSSEVAPVATQAIPEEPISVTPVASEQEPLSQSEAEQVRAENAVADELQSEMPVQETVIQEQIDIQEEPDELDEAAVFTPAPVQEEEPEETESPAERLRAAKAAIAALTGEPVDEHIYAKDIQEEVAPAKDTPITIPDTEGQERQRAEMLSALGGPRVDELKRETEEQAQMQQPASAEDESGQDYRETARAESAAPVVQPVVEPQPINQPAVPDWYRTAREKAKKNFTPSNNVHRSRYADALDSAVKESSVFFNEANQLLDEETESRLRNMRRGISEVKAPRIPEAEQEPAAATPVASVPEQHAQPAPQAPVQEQPVQQPAPVRETIATSEVIEEVVQTSQDQQPAAQPAVAKEAAPAQPVRESQPQAPEAPAAPVAQQPVAQPAAVPVAPAAKPVEKPAAPAVESAPVPEQPAEPEEQPVATAPAITETTPAVDAVKPVQMPKPAPAPEPRSQVAYAPAIETQIPSAQTSRPAAPQPAPAQSPIPAPQPAPIALAPDVPESAAPAPEQAKTVNDAAVPQVKQEAPAPRIQQETPPVPQTVEPVPVSPAPVQIPEIPTVQETRETQGFADAAPAPVSAQSIPDPNKVYQDNPELGETIAMKPIQMPASLYSDRMPKPAPMKATSDTVRPRVKLPEIPSANMAPIADTAKQNAPLAEAAEVDGKTAAKSLLSGMIPKIDAASLSGDLGKPAANADSSVVGKRQNLMQNLPSLSGSITNEPGLMTDKPEKVVSATGSFTAVSATGAFKPVGDELVADVAPEDRYVEDADDSVEEGGITETGAFASPDYVDMPKSRRGHFLSRFRRKNKRKDRDNESTPQEWLNVEDDFDAREVGRERGDWDSFQEGNERGHVADRQNDMYEDAPYEGYETYDANDGAVPNGTYTDNGAYAETDVYGDPNYPNNGTYNQGNLSETYDDYYEEDYKEYPDDNKNAGKTQKWQGGAFSGRRSSAGRTVVEQDGEEPEDLYNDVPAAGEERASGRKGKSGGLFNRVKDAAGNAAGAANRKERSSRNGAQDEQRSSRSSHPRRAPREGAPARAPHAAPNAPVRTPRVSEELQEVYQFAEDTLDTEVWFVALGAQESGNAGINQFIEAHREDLRGAMIVSLEGLGAGTLGYGNTEGIFKKHSPSTRLKRFLHTASQATGISLAQSDQTWRNSTANAAMAAGLQAVSIMGLDGNKPALYAQSDDVLENIDEELMKRNADFVMEFLKAF